MTIAEFLELGFALILTAAIGLGAFWGIYWLYFYLNKYDDQLAKFFNKIGHKISGIFWKIFKIALWITGIGVAIVTCFYIHDKWVAMSEIKQMGMGIILAVVTAGYMIAKSIERNH